MWEKASFSPYKMISWLHAIIIYSYDSDLKALKAIIIFLSYIMNIWHLALDFLVEGSQFLEKCV